MAHPALRGDEADVFAAHHDKLFHVLRRRVNASEALIEDAISMTWVIFLRAQPERTPTLFGWLVIVAEREAWRLCKRSRSTIAIDELECLDMPHAPVVEAVVDARDRLDRGARAMTARQRQIVGLKAAGYRYDEIAQFTGDSVRTVERQLLRGRARARAAA